MARVKKKRSYDATGRRTQAETTRARIRASARRLWVAHGYGGTTVAAIAEGAGVAEATVFAAYGSKRAILFAMLDELEGIAEEAVTFPFPAAERPPREQIAALSHFHARLFEAGSDLIRAAREAGRGDAEFDALRVEGERRRRTALAPIVRGWAADGILRPGLTEAEALDVLFVLFSDLQYSELVDNCGWSVERYRGWLEAAVQRLLLH
jgi:AcrR family transcriptional regulator